MFERLGKATQLVKTTIQHIGNGIQATRNFSKNVSESTIARVLPHIFSATTSTTTLYLIGVSPVVSLVIGSTAPLATAGINHLSNGPSKGSNILGVGAGIVAGYAGAGLGPAIAATAVGIATYKVTNAAAQNPIRTTTLGVLATGLFFMNDVARGIGRAIGSITVEPLITAFEARNNNETYLEASMRRHNITAQDFKDAFQTPGNKVDLKNYPNLRGNSPLNELNPTTPAQPGFNDHRLQPMIPATPAPESQKPAHESKGIPLKDLMPHTKQDEFPRKQASNEAISDKAYWLTVVTSGAAKERPVQGDASGKLANEVPSNGVKLGG
jgi:hypothetical protein